MEQAVMAITLGLINK